MNNHRAPNLNSAPSKYEELFKYTDENPLDEILAQVRERLKSSDDQLTIIDASIKQLRNYTRKLAENKDIMKVHIELHKLRRKIDKGRIPLEEFAHYIDLINEHASDREIWEHIIRIGQVLNFKEPPSRPDIVIPY
ncbi:BgTH12-05405 [Blumeria graminis f. sp. triticale]|uniref:BgTH12-05405 n=1 Tax=Blumeria graminis f. sp. triticale TaxID=1689686 RepID=A0A9W4D2A4_BLUGR|nr:BgTH12-05405 [Blumeria graminis f. sp. triticale]